MAASLGQEDGGSESTVVVVQDRARVRAISATAPGVMAFCITEGFGARGLILA